jgi:hypothetical protein
LTENKTEAAKYLFPDGFEYFMYNTKLLTGIGIRVPEIIDSGHYSPEDYDYALVECFKGISFDEYIKSGGKTDAYAEELVDLMNTMALYKRSYCGSTLETMPYDISAQQIAYNFYNGELNIASGIDSDVAAIKDRISDLMKRKMSGTAEAKRQDYCLIHGELTPPHVFILDTGNIGIIDIEGIKYFDPEYDWAVINFMYGNAIHLPENIDMKKLEFYKICLNVGYMSVSADYLAHIDSCDEVYRDIRRSNLRALKLML